MINGVKLKNIDRFELDLINGYYCIHLYYSDVINDHYGTIMIYYSKDFNEVIRKYDDLVDQLYTYKYEANLC